MGKYRCNSFRGEIGGKLSRGSHFCFKINHKSALVSIVCDLPFLWSAIFIWGRVWLGGVFASTTKTEATITAAMWLRLQPRGLKQEELQNKHFPQSWKSLLHDQKQIQYRLKKTHLQTCFYRPGGHICTTSGKTLDVLQSDPSAKMEPYNWIGFWK